MKTVALGSQGLSVSELGFGCMGLTTAYGSKLSDDAIVSLLKATYEKGVNFWDTANLYVFPDMWRLLKLQSPVVCQEEIICKALHDIGRENIIIATKTGISISFFPKLTLRACGEPSFIRRQCEASLSRLKTDYIDLFYLHRIDQDIPIEKSMMEMKRLVEEGKVRHVGLSECSASTIRRAHRVHPLTAVQLEYSLWCRGIENEIMDTCVELGIGIVAYSPLGRGFFGMKSDTQAKFGAGDFRANQERMTGETGAHNQSMLRKVEEIATQKGVSTTQLALAWVRAQQTRKQIPGLVPIPGTTKMKNLESNVASVDIDLSEDDIAAIEAAIPADQVKGSRYSDQSSGMWENDRNKELTVDEARELGLGSE